MGWSVGFDSNWNRDIGYGVPAYCDHPGCMEKINRGLSYVCGGEPYGGERGCGLFFCEKHRGYVDPDEDRCCQHVEQGLEFYPPTPDHPDWIIHKMTDESWQQWRVENGVDAPVFTTLTPKEAQQ